IRLYLLGTCMGAVLLQRRVLPLHGSAVVVDGCAYAIVGDSGAGKSTLASAFLQRGYQCMSDDVIPVTLSYKGSPIVTPAYPQQKLWKNSLHQFGVDTANLFPIIDREEKFAVPISTQFAKTQVPLAGVFELMKTEDGMIKVNSMQNLERLFKLFYHTYRPFFVEQLHLLEWHFNMCTKVISSVRMYQLYRPSSGFTANELVDVMLSTIKVKERAH